MWWVVTTASHSGNLSPRLRGFWSAAAAALALGVALNIAGSKGQFVLHPIGPNTDELVFETPPFWTWLSLVILIATYGAAIALTVRRSTRRLGRAILIWFTCMLPVAAVIGAPFFYQPL